MQAKVTSMILASNNPAKLLDIYDQLQMRKQQLAFETLNVDRQIEDARVQLKSALTNRHVSTIETTSEPAEEIENASPQSSPQVFEQVPFSTLGLSTKKALSPLLKAFTTSKGVFSVKDVATTLKVSEATASWRVHRGVKLGYYKATDHRGKYERA